MFDKWKSAVPSVWVYFLDYQPEMISQYFPYCLSFSVTKHTHAHAHCGTPCTTSTGILVNKRGPDTGGSKVESTREIAEGENILSSSDMVK